MIASFIVNISFIYFLGVIGMRRGYFTNRYDVVTDQNYFFNTHVFLLVVIGMSSFIVFYWIVKFFGYEMLIVVGFFMTFFVSFLIELFNISIESTIDLNKSAFGIRSFNTNFEDQLLGLTFVLNFFIGALYFTMNFYITKFTKTLYRCFFFGICKVFFDLMMLLATLTSLFFEKSNFYISISSVLGLINTYFMYHDFDYTIISEFRKLELNNKSGEDI